jgi:hypothetical protein
MKRGCLYFSVFYPGRIQSEEGSFYVLHAEERLSSVLIRSNNTPN